MSAINAPFGFRPAFNPIGYERAKKFPIPAGYATQIQRGQPVTLTGRQIAVGAPAIDLLGIFWGCEYQDTNGKPWVSSYWPAGQTVMAGTQPIAWVFDDINETYEVQADGSVPWASIGAQGDVTNVSATQGVPSTGNVMSAATLASALVAAGVQGQFRVVGFSGSIDNVPGDAFTVCQVQIARHIYLANKVAV